MSSKITIKILLISVGIFFLSCNNNPAKKEEIKLVERRVDKCGQNFSIDTSKLKLENVKNLELYNGIRFLKFDEKLESYLNCLRKVDMVNDAIDTTSLSETLYFLESVWNVEVFFYNKSLCRIELKQSETSSKTIFNKLQNLFSQPNMQNVEVVQSFVNNNIHLIYGTDLDHFKPYSEELNNLKNEYTNPKKIDYGKPLPMYSFSDQDFQRNRYGGGSKRVRIKYYPQVNFQCKWQSKVVLQLNIIRKTNLQTGMGQILREGGDRTPMENGYYVNSKEETVINLYKNKEIIKLFESEVLRNTRTIDSIVTQNELKEKKKLLEEF